MCICTKNLYMDIIDIKNLMEIVYSSEELHLGSMRGQFKRLDEIRLNYINNRKSKKQIYIDLGTLLKNDGRQIIKDVKNLKHIYYILKSNLLHSLIEESRFGIVNESIIVLNNLLELNFLNMEKEEEIKLLSIKISNVGKKELPSFHNNIKEVIKYYDENKLRESYIVSQSMYFLQRFNNIFSTIIDKMYKEGIIDYYDTL